MRFESSLILWKFLCKFRRFLLSSAIVCSDVAHSSSSAILDEKLNMGWNILSWHDHQQLIVLHDFIRCGTVALRHDTSNKVKKKLIKLKFEEEEKWIFRIEQETNFHRAPTTLNKFIRNSYFSFNTLFIFPPSSRMWTEHLLAVFVSAKVLDSVRGFFNLSCLSFQGGGLAGALNCHQSEERKRSKTKRKSRAA